MATTLYVPQWGMGITEGKVTAWLKRAGDEVTEGEPIVELETAKAAQEIEAPASGILARILVEEGTTVPVREALAIIAAPDEVID